jgi:hypothetical protein
LPVTIAPISTALAITENQVLSGAGTVAQYIRGDGSLADFPESSGGGSSVSYYLNGSVNQGTIGGVAYKELNKVPILGAGTDFSINADGYIASFITDAGDPNLLEIPGGNWNFETYFSASSSGGTPTFYVELYKVSGTTATLIASSVTSPEFIAFGTTLTPYFSSLAVPTTTLALTDRLAVRYYVTHSGRTITMHTENNHLCQIITTFTTGLTALNGLTAQVQFFAVGTSGTDFNIASATATHTFNLPTASGTNRGALSSSDWTTFNNKENAITAGTTAQYFRGDKTFQTLNTSVVPESGNLYFTQARVSANTDVAANTAARHAAVTLGVANGLGLSGQQLSLGLASAGVTGALSGTDWSTFNSKQQALNGTGFVKISGTTISYDNSTYLTTAAAASTYLPLAGGTMTGQIVLTTGTGGGIRFPNDPFGGGADTAGMRLISRGGEAMSLEIYTTNDADDWVNISVPSNDSAKVNGNTIWNSGNITPVPTSRTITINGNTQDLSANRTYNVGTVTSVAALTLGTSGTDLSSTVANSTTTPVITLNVPTASATNRGALSAADWTTFNNKQNALTNPVTGTGTTNTLPKFTGTSTIGNSIISESGSVISIAGNLNVGSLGNLAINAGSAATPLLTQSTNYTELYRRSGGVGIYLGGTGDPANYYDNAIHYFRSSGGGATRMTLDNSGNLGLGVTPSAWGSQNTVLQLLNNTSLISRSGFTALARNLFYTTSDVAAYISNGVATNYLQIDGEHRWLNALSGTAGATMTQTQAMTLDASGNLLVGTTTGTARATIAVANAVSTARTVLSLTDENQASLSFILHTELARINTGGTDDLAFGTNNSERMRITSSGRVLIGTPPPAESTFQLDVAGTARVSGDALYVFGTGNIEIGRDTTYSTPYMTVGFGGRSNGFNRIYGARDTTDGLYLSSATGRGIRLLTNGDTVSALTLASGGAATFSSSVTTGSLTANGVATFTRSSKSILLNPNLVDENTTALIDVTSGMALALATGGTTRLSLASSGAATFSSSVTARQGIINGLGGSRYQMLTLTGGGTSDEGLFITTTGTGNDFYAIKVATGANANAFALTNAGNVGIGTTSPVYKFEVSDGTRTGVFNPNSTLDGFFIGTFQSKPLILGTADSERMRITSGGNVLIGTTTDDGSRLRVNGVITISPITSAPTYDTSTRIWMEDFFGTRYDGFQHRFDAGATRGEAMRITSNREVLIGGNVDNGAYNLQCNGTGVWGAGAYVNGSDRNIKDNIATIEKGLEYIQKMNPVKFRYKPNYTRDHSMQTGFIAQELQEVFASEDYLSGLVQQGVHLSVAYQNLLPVLVKAIQELKQEIDTLKN